MKKTYIMILAGLAIVGASTTYCFSQSNQELAPEAMAPAAAPAATAPVAAPAAPVTPTEVDEDDARKAFSYFIGYRFGQEVSAGATTLTADDFDRTPSSRLSRTASPASSRAWIRPKSRPA